MPNSWRTRIRAVLSSGLLAGALVACSGDAGTEQENAAQTCMLCHNASQRNDYSGPGIENPHPFGDANNLRCTECHGGNGAGADALAAHVPPPPEIGDDENLRTNRTAYFNRLTLTGIDKYPDYTVDGKTYTALQYLRFINPGDLRVVKQGVGCGKCHEPHARVVGGSLLATEAGILSGATYAAGTDNLVPGSDGLHGDTAADLAFRAIHDADFSLAAADIGAVPELDEFPVISVRGGTGPDDLFNNPTYDAAELADDQHADGRVITGSPLDHLYREQVAFTCGDCHLGSAGANNRYGDFRSSGCTSCHMPYSLSGRSGSRDPNVDKLEPLDPDDIDPPEIPHVRAHRIVSIARTDTGGQVTPGIDDYACAGCHQGSNRTVMQYWGIRLDQNQDVRRRVQYPADPVSYQTTRFDERLFDPEVDNRTFNGRNHNQYLLMEDYDGDGRDDTPPDVHYEAGLGCIDCHGSHDLHGGDVSDPDGQPLYSRMEQGVAIRCESCHGAPDAYATTTAGTTYDGQPADLATDAEGHALRHVVREGPGEYWLTSRLTGARHYVPQTRDTVVDSGTLHPVTGAPLYSAHASYAMGRADGDPATGLGPQQTGGVSPGFSHTDDMDCASCHASWTNSCIGCHLEGEYDGGNNFSNITGERIVFREDNALFAYQSPVPFQLGVNARGKITQTSPNSGMFFSWEDRNNDRSDTFAFSNRNGGGNNPAARYPSLNHNAMLAHSIRGKVSTTMEGPRYCVACHMTDDGLASFGTQYDTFRTALAGGDFGSLDYHLLQDHIGRNPGNTLNSPLWVHMVSGLGSGLFLFDENGCPVNPLDFDDNRAGCDGTAPGDIPFDPSRVLFDLDRIVEGTGFANGSNNHPFLVPGAGAALRDGAQNPNLAGPFGERLLWRLTDPTRGIVLDSWFDADGLPRGDAAGFVDEP